MRNLELNVGMLCNNRCVFCISGDARSRERGWLPLDRALAEIESFRALGCRSLGFLGGEPTAYPHLLDCVRRAKALGYERIAVCSNGMKYAEERFVEALLEAGVTRFGLSIHSHRPEVEDALTRVPGNLERKLKGLRYLLAQKARGRVPDNVSLNAVLARPNLHELVDYARFYRALGVDDIRFNYIWPQSEVVGDRGMVPSYREAMPEVFKAIAFNEVRWRMHLTFGGVPRCMLRWAGLPLSAELAWDLGRRYLSEDDDLPTLVYTRGDRFSWQDRKRGLLKRRGPDCRPCPHAGSCDGVWKTYADIYGTAELVPLEA